MPAAAIRILDFDTSVTQQANLLRQFQPEIINLLNLGPFARLWMNRSTASKISQSLSAQAKHSVTFLGSGDFHNISNLLISRFTEPISVIVFDHHPDWDIFPPKLGCGSWVSRILELPQVQKVVLLGISSSDISYPSIQSGNLAALEDNRLEIYPYAHLPTKVFLRNVPDNLSIRVEPCGFLRKKIIWQELHNLNLEEFFKSLINRLPRGKVYVSVDKDCLLSEYSLTNWEEGKMSLEELLLCLRLIRESLDIAGIDITGDYSDTFIPGKFKQFISRLDHPIDYSAKDKSQAEINSLNEETNIKILEELNGYI